MIEPLRPRRGGFLRAFGCGWFIHQFLAGNAPYGSPKIDPDIGAPQADIFFFYKAAIIAATALDRATRIEERQARRDGRPIDPDRIERLAAREQRRLPYKSTACRYHSLVIYFANIKRLGWVEASGYDQRSAFQDHYSPGPPRRYYRLTPAGKLAADAAWKNPLRALYG